MICTVIYNLCMPITNNDDYIATVHFKNTLPCTATMINDCNVASYIFCVIAGNLCSE